MAEDASKGARASRITETDGGGRADGEGPSLRRRIGLLAGPLAFAVLLLAPAPAGLGLPGWRTAALGVLMAVWWLTEAIPIPATALLPLALLPLLGAGGIDEAARPYANPVIFLFMGGFLLALGMQRWRLHRRIALHILLRTGSRPAALVGGFMVASALLSMWVSNTATAMMMLPIGVSVIELLRGAARRRDVELAGGAEFGVALMLAIAYAASLGGLGTLVGTPPNAFLAGFLAESYGIELGFARWMMLGVPLVIVSVPLAWWILVRLVFRLGREELPGGRRLIRRQLEAQGPMSRGERVVATVFTGTALLWIFRPLLDGPIPGLSDAGIAVAGGLALFLIPVELRRGIFALDWEWAGRLPWDILILFGGGLSLAAAIDRTGLNGWLGGLAGAWGEAPAILFVAAVTAAVVLLTELTSNTATAAAFLPILGSVAVRLEWSPLLLTIPAALAASCAFMLPVATPPNAIVYGSHEVTVPQMARAGIWLNVLMVAVVTAAVFLLVPVVFGTGTP